MPKLKCLSLYWTRIIVRLLAVREFMLQSTLFQKYNAKIQLTNNKWAKFQILGSQEHHSIWFAFLQLKGGSIAGLLGRWWRGHRLRVWHRPSALMLGWWWWTPDRWWLTSHYCWWWKRPGRSLWRWWHLLHTRVWWPELLNLRWRWHRLLRMPGWLSRYWHRLECSSLRGWWTKSRNRTRSDPISKGTGRHWSNPISLRNTGKCWRSTGK